MTEDDEMVQNRVEQDAHEVSLLREKNRSSKPPFHFEDGTLIEDVRPEFQANAIQDLSYIEEQATAINTAFIQIENQLRRFPDTSINRILISLAPEGRKILNLQSYVETRLDTQFKDHQPQAQRVLRRIKHISQRLDVFYDNPYANVNIGLVDLQQRPTLVDFDGKRISPFEKYVRTAIAAAVIGLPVQNLGRGLEQFKGTDSRMVSVQNAETVDIPGVLMGNQEATSESDKQPILRVPETPAQQEVGGIYELLTLPSEGNIRSGTTTRSEVLFNFDAIRNYNAGHPTEELVVQLVSIVQGDQAYNDGNTDWFQLNIVGRNPATIVPEPFSQGGFVFSGVLAPEVRDAATVTLTATPGTPEAGDPVTQPAPEAEPAPIAPSPQPQPPTPEPQPETGGTPPPDTETPGGSGDPATPVPPLSPGAGAPGGEAGIEIVDAGQRALLESARETQYNAFPPDIRTRIDAGEIWFDYEMGTFAQRNERGIPIYWAGGMAEQDGTVVGDWLEVMDQFSHNGTQIIIRMNPDTMSQRPRNGGFSDMNITQEGQQNIANWLDTFGTALRGETILIDLIPSWTSTNTHSTVIVTPLQGGPNPNGTPILALNALTTESGLIRVKLYVESLGTAYPRFFPGEDLQAANLGFYSKGVYSSLAVANGMMSLGFNTLSGDELRQVYESSVNDASYRAMLPTNGNVNDIPLSQQPKLVNVIPNTP